MTKPASIVAWLRVPTGSKIVDYQHAEAADLIELQVTKIGGMEKYVCELESRLETLPREE